MDSLTRDALLLLLETVHAERERANSLAERVEHLRVALTALRAAATPEEEEKIERTLRDLSIRLLGTQERSDETLAKLAAMAKKVDQAR